MNLDQARGGVWAIVPAAGRGARFGGDVPKQYVDAGGAPVIAHTLAALLGHRGIAGAVVVLSADDARWPRWTEFAGKPLLACSGGAQRADSVLAGLAALPDSVRPDDFVLVHDAARPNLREHDLAALLERGRDDPVGAILAAPVRDTLKRAGDDGGIDGTEPRERLCYMTVPYEHFEAGQRYRLEARSLAFTPSARLLNARGEIVATERAIHCVP